MTKGKRLGLIRGPDDAAFTHRFRLMRRECETITLLRRGPSWPAECGWANDFRDLGGSLGAGHELNGLLGLAAGCCCGVVGCECAPRRCLSRIIRNSQLDIPNPIKLQNGLPASLSDVDEPYQDIVACDASALLIWILALLPCDELPGHQSQFTCEGTSEGSPPGTCTPRGRGVWPISPAVSFCEPKFGPES
jgi:hypothetical protein